MRSYLSPLHCLYHLLASAPEPKETGTVKAQKALRELPMPCTVCLEVAGIRATAARRALST